MTTKKPNGFEPKTEQNRQKTEQKTELSSVKNRTEHRPPSTSRPQRRKIIRGTKKRVLKLISEGVNLTRIAKKLNKAKSTITQHHTELQELEYVEKKHNLWHITYKGKQYLESSVSVVGYEGEFGFCDRAHNIKIKIKVRATPKNNNWLCKWKANHDMNNNTFYHRSIDGVDYTYTGKSLIVQLPSLHYESAEIAVSDSMRIGMELAEELERDVPGLKLGDPSVKLGEMTTQHHALENHPTAKFLHKHGISYKGKAIDADNSTGCAPELEFTDHKNAHLHYTQYIENMEDQIMNEVPKPSLMARVVGTMQKQLVQLANKSEKTAEQLNQLVELTKFNAEQIQAILTMNMCKEEKSEECDYIG